MLNLNQTAFTTGETLQLTATLPFTPLLADAYVVARLPDGSVQSLLLDGRLVPGLIPIARSFMPFAFSAEVFRFRLTGTEPPGPYTWLGGLTHAGTLRVIGTIDQTIFTVMP